MEDKDHSKSLQAYETSAYKRIWCEANQEDKTGVENCQAFFSLVLESMIVKSLRMVVSI